jgi:hypothetical protein
MAREGASRMSSVLGLNASPQSAKVRPCSFPEKCVRIFLTSTCFWRVLTASTALRISGLCCTSFAERISACTSLGKHEPP